MRLRLVALAAIALSSGVGLACSHSQSQEDLAASEDEVTSVENTGVKRQAIANCWLYATAGWIESLHKGATARDLDASEAYWNYWYWYEQITGGDITLDPKIHVDAKKVKQGGWWGLGAELPHYLPSMPGYNDIFIDYLDRPKKWGDADDGHMLVKIALPPGLRFEIPASGSP